MATEEKVETTENSVLESNFRLFGIFRMSWKDIKELSDEDKKFLLDKADMVEEQAKKQAEMQRQMLQQQQQQQQQQRPQAQILTPEQAMQETSKLPEL